MKQVYKKPMARVEYFALSQTIANYCGTNNTDLGFASLNERPGCGWQIDNDIFWTATEGSGCNVPTDPNAVIEGICYHNPNGGVSVFNS